MNLEHVPTGPEPSWVTVPSRCWSPTHGVHALDCMPLTALSELKHARHEQKCENMQKNVVHGKIHTYPNNTLQPATFLAPFLLVLALAFPAKKIGALVKIFVREKTWTQIPLWIQTITDILHHTCGFA